MPGLLPGCSYICRPRGCYCRGSCRAVPPRHTYKLGVSVGIPAGARTMRSTHGRRKQAWLYRLACIAGSRQNQALYCQQVS